MFTCKKYLDRIENIKKNALRFVLDGYTWNYHDLLIQCEVSGLKNMTLHLLAIEVFKCVNKLDPEYLNEIFTIRQIRTPVLRIPPAVTSQAKMKNWLHECQKWVSHMIGQYAHI